MHLWYVSVVCILLTCGSISGWLLIVICISDVCCATFIIAASEYCCYWPCACVSDMCQWCGQGWMETTLMFYGHYHNRTYNTGDDEYNYNMGLAYMLAVVIIFLISFVLILMKWVRPFSLVLSWSSDHPHQLSHTICICAVLIISFVLILMKWVKPSSSVESHLPHELCPDH